MSTMLSTQNPEAAAAIGIDHLPGPGTWVVFHHRPGQQRAGMLEVPALVMRRNEDNRYVDLMLWYASDDIVNKHRVVRRAGSDEGWEYPDDGRRGNDPLDEPFKVLVDENGDPITVESVYADLESFKAELSTFLLGDEPKPSETFFATLKRLDERLAALERPAKPKRQAQQG